MHDTPEPSMVPLNPSHDVATQLIDSEPQSRALIACEVNVGVPIQQRWEKRTYEAVRVEPDAPQFRVHFGEGCGPGELFTSWERVCQFLWSMRARAIEILIQ